VKNIYIPAAFAEGMDEALGTFARSELEAELGSDGAAGIERALLHYARRVGDGDPPPALPRFLEGDGRPSPSQLTAHAVMVYLADRERPGSQVLSAGRRS
jgi:hypothetical protein